ncbi:hypothetical protein M3A49_34100 [Paraburkholderia sp. CNPSo 3076]|uniref:hypothetical protein n=1 Tax=Paraburkholderia sp. CNPSo 3076 TaxID=2940936 RepID=UPI00225A1F1C|nr:hypothetical protein [Paraburkholderia sp. CNPSo 3076]MCX5544439.1 hypothetical protein [Paraburkholderia sp. CNPSo 3076]
MSDIDYSLFGPASIRKAVEAIRERPKLTRDEFVKLEREKNNLMARFDEVTTIMQPLEESYVAVRRRMDPKYEPDKDRRLQEVNKAGSDRHEQLLKQIEPLHETWKQVVAARDASRYLVTVLGECLKLCEVLNMLTAAERGTPPTND